MVNRLIFVVVAVVVVAACSLRSGIWHEVSESVADQRGPERLVTIAQR